MSELVFDLSPTQYAFVTSNANIVQIKGPMGEGKCHAPGTPILMYSGDVRTVEDIAAGDLLMGDDSTPRTVLSTASGRGRMYTVVPFRGEPFTVNGEHILSLKRTRTRRSRSGRPYHDRLAGSIVDVSVNDFLTWSATARSIHKLYRAGVSFPQRPVSIDPYWLGVWLGDGTARNTSITTPDREIVDYIHQYAKCLRLQVTTSELQDNLSDTYSITNGQGHGSCANPLLDAMRGYGLLQNKHIPAEYKCNCSAVRMKVLAGLADSDGYVNRNSYQWTLASRTLAEDIVFLTRSLGFAAYLSVVTKTIKSSGFSGTYYQVGVSGDLSGVPALIERKRCRPRKNFKDVLVTGIKEIIPAGEDDFFGFVIDGNHRYLMGDFTVTHNTVAGIAGCYAHAQRFGKVITGAVVRDTLQNIKTSTIPSMRKLLGKYVRIFDDNKKATLFAKPNVPCVELDLFGVDSEESVTKLQGTEYAIIWLEEPAPVEEKANAGLPKSVFKMAVARAAREAGTAPRVQITQNPSDDDHWTAELEDEPEIYAEYTDPASGEVFRIIKECFNIKPGENKYLSGLSRAANIAAFKDDPAKFARYVEGKTASTQRGKKVTPAYDENVHFSKVVLPVYADQQLITMWDGWHHPSCILGQYNPKGQLVLHDACIGDGMGAEDLIEDMLMPLLLSSKYRGKIFNLRIIGDPSMCTPDQSSVRRVTSKIIEKMLARYGRPRFERGPVRWPARRDPVNQCFKRRINAEGLPAVVISRSAVALHRAFKGGWHYKTDNSGRVIGDKPMQDKHDHPGQAFAYGIAKLMPYNPARNYKRIMAAVAAANRRRAASYAGNNFRRTGAGR